MFRDFGSASVGSRIRWGATEDEKAAGIARQDADIDLSGAPPGHHPAWHVEFRGRKRLHRLIRIKPRQNRLSGTDPRRRRVLPDPALGLACL